VAREREGERHLGYAADEGDCCSGWENGVSGLSERPAGVLADLSWSSESGRLGDRRGRQHV